MARSPKSWFAFIEAREKMAREGLRCPRCEHHSRSMTVLEDAAPPGFRCDACQAALSPGDVGASEERFEYEGGAIVLYRPVGQAELELIEASGWRRFPPRLSWQPIFYPVLNRGYAEEIAGRWNTIDEGSGKVGHVTRFRVAAAVARRYPVKVVGGAEHQELWVPSEELDAFNDAILGPIEAVASFKALQA